MMTQFWITTPLEKMTPEQWESLCDGCGKCCLNKIIDDETDELYYTNAACHLLDNDTCGCRRYPNRFTYVPECTAITPENIAELTWLPDSCAYRRLHVGKDLPSCHPLLTGNKEAMHAAGISVQGKTVNEMKVKYLEDCIVLWPMLDVE